MPQVFQVLKCYKCEFFQEGLVPLLHCIAAKIPFGNIILASNESSIVAFCKVHLRKKSFKWECKMCGEKQSVKRNYGLGTAQECRTHVQRLNDMQGNKSESLLFEDDSEDNDFTECSKKTLKYASMKNNRKSKWSAFIEDEDNINTSNEPECYKEAEVVLELPKSQKRKMPYKQTDNPDEYTKTNYSNNKKIKNDGQTKQCIKKFVIPNKCKPVDNSENEYFSNFNEISNYNKNENPLGTTNWNYESKYEEKLKFDKKPIHQNKWLAYTSDSENVPKFKESMDISSWNYGNKHEEILEVDIHAQQNKWLAYTLENENTSNIYETASNKNCNSLETTKLKHTNKKEEPDFDKRLTKDMITNLDTNYKAENERYDLSFARNFAESNEDVVDFIVEDNKSVILGQEQKWSEFLEKDKPDDFKTNKEKSQAHNGNKYMFSLCDDEELDTILEF